MLSSGIVLAVPRGGVLYSWYELNWLYGLYCEYVPTVCEVYGGYCGTFTGNSDGVSPGGPAGG